MVSQIAILIIGIPMLYFDISIAGSIIIPFPIHIIVYGTLFVFSGSLTVTNPLLSIFINR